MDVKQVNLALAAGVTDQKGLFPHLEELRTRPCEFRVNFGLEALPEEPGIILIRGARQYGKSTWLERELKATVRAFGPGSAYFLNGDALPDVRALVDEIRALTAAFSSTAEVRRLFIDEITSVKNWEMALKQLADSGDLRHVLVVTTGSRASDLRRGAERLPGRKGKLSKTDYLFTPISYSEFCRVCGRVVDHETLNAYAISGGSPLACAELAATGRIPEYVINLTRDWIFGEFARSGRDRGSLLHVLSCIHRFGGTPVGQAKLAREAGLANNTVANGYVELLIDLLCISRSYAWDASRSVRLPRKPCKYHFVNTLVALAYDPQNPRTVEDFKSRPAESLGPWWEWVVAQELWRRAAIRGDVFPEDMYYWQSGERELDFAVSKGHFIEVKRGKSNPLEFAWFSQVFPRSNLTVLSASKFSTDHVKGISMEDFLLQEP